MRDSNPRMVGPEPTALPLGESPTNATVITRYENNYTTNSLKKQRHCTDSGHLRCFYFPCMLKRIEHTLIRNYVINGLVYSLRKASTGSFLLAARAGITPPISVSMIERAIKNSAIL